jgi:Periplasmic component of the Tol biopolymer transport system
MKKKILWGIAGAAAMVAALVAQQGGRSDIRAEITKGELATIAIPDFRGAGGAQPLMGVFNETLFREVQNSGLFKMAPKSFYPLQTPQRPQDFQPSARRGSGLTLADWSGPPVNAHYLAFGYTAEQNGQLVLFGWLYNVGQPDISNAQVIGKVYLGPLNEEGARKVAREFAADILAQFGATSLIGSKIYFVSNRTGHKEIWSMDYDGSNQKPVTAYRSITTMPAVSLDGSMLAFTTYARGNPSIMIHLTSTNRRLPFYNQQASMNATPSFTPDGKTILFSSTLSGIAQIYAANIDGSGLRKLSSVRAIEVEPKVNPKNGVDVVFVSGRSGPQQIYKMNLDGADVVRLTTGEGEASNPAWHPNGQHIAFAWTRGFEPGNWNIFVMDVTTRETVQLTHGRGRNENPSWSPDGRHIVFSSNRSGSTQIWTMLADGTQARQLTTEGQNQMPVWSK